MRKTKVYKGTSIDNVTDLFSFNKRVSVKKHAPGDYSYNGIPIYMNDKHNTIVYVPKHKRSQLKEIEQKYRDYLDGMLKNTHIEQQNIFKGDPVINE